MLPVEIRHDGRQKREAIEFGNQTRTDPGNSRTVPLGQAVREEDNLDEFIEVTGFHRKHAIRALKRPAEKCVEPAARSRIYDEAVRGALTILWEAADRICGKRLKEAIPTLVELGIRPVTGKPDCVSLS
jgi:hypothetical protein